MIVFDETDYSRFHGREKRIIEELMSRLTAALRAVLSSSSIALMATDILSNYVEYQTKESSHLVRHGHLGDSNDKQVRIYFRIIPDGRHDVVLVDISTDYDIQAVADQIYVGYTLSPYYKRDEN